MSSFPLTALLVIAWLCFALPLLIPLPPPVDGDLREANLPLFAPDHVLGTDLNGNDVLSRLLHGGRASLMIAIGVNVPGLLLGASLGAWAALRGGFADTLVMRLLDVLIAFPSLVLVLALAQAFEGGLEGSVLALLSYSMPAYARLARAATLRLRDQPFVLSSTLYGGSAWTILHRHIAPNILPQLIVFGLLAIGNTIILEGALNFLGLGLRPPAPSWGGMIQQGQQALSIRPALVLLPSLSLFITVLAFNRLGETLRQQWSLG